MVGGPAHGPRVDVVQLAACARARALVALAILKELLLAISHCRRDGAVVSRRETPPPQSLQCDIRSQAENPVLPGRTGAVVARILPTGAKGSRRRSEQASSLCIPSTRSNRLEQAATRSHHCGQPAPGEQARDCRQLHDRTLHDFVQGGQLGCQIKPKKNI